MYKNTMGGKNNNFPVILWCFTFVLFSVVVMVTQASSKSTIVTSTCHKLSTVLPEDYIFVRGGTLESNFGIHIAEDEYDDFYDDDYDEEEYDDLEEEEDREDRYQSRRRMPPSPPSSRSRPPPSRGRYPPPGRRRPPPPKKKSPSIASNMVNTVSSIAKSSLDMTTTATVASLKGTGKAAYYLASPKHVSRPDIVGVWRLDQNSLEASCAANIELTMRGDVLVTYEGEEFRTPYFFAERSWPRSCTIQFEARAFQGPRDKEPVNMLYVASFRKKIADRNVIKMIGKIYQITHTKGKFPFGGNVSTKTLVGTFTARKRFTPPPPAAKRRRDSSQKRGRPSQSLPKPKRTEFVKRNDESDYDDNIIYDYDDNYDEYD